jgi:TonB family protein
MLFESRRPAVRPAAGGVVSLAAHVGTWALVVGVGGAGASAPVRLPRPRAVEALRWVRAAATPEPPREAPTTARTTRTPRGARPAGGRAAIAPPDPVAALAAAPIPIADLAAVALPEFDAEASRLGLRATDAGAFAGAVRPTEIGADPVAVLREPGHLYRREDVERVPLAETGTLGPEYPANLLRLRLAGEVLVQFVVDSTGTADRRSIRVLRATHPAFARSVEIALGAARFLPGEVQGQRVRVLVEQRYFFRIH